jgi:hypothetical protein
MTQAEVMYHGRASKVEIAIGKSKVFISNFRITKQEWEYICTAKYFKRGSDHLNFSSNQFAILRTWWASSYLSYHLNDILRTQAVCQFREDSIVPWAKNHLCFSLSVAKIYKNYATVVTARIYPTTKRRLNTNVCETKCPTATSSIPHWRQ